MPELHTKCRAPNVYVHFAKKIPRLEVPDDKVDWKEPLEDYEPQVFNANHLASAPFADPDIEDPDFHPNFNDLDGTIDRYTNKSIHSPLGVLVIKVYTFAKIKLG